MWYVSLVRTEWNLHKLEQVVTSTVNILGLNNHQTRLCWTIATGTICQAGSTSYLAYADQEKRNVRGINQVFSKPCST